MRRFLIVLVLPLLVLAGAYIVVFYAASGGGSFMGLLAMPVAGMTLLVVLGVGINAARSDGGLLRPVLTSIAIVLVPAAGLLVVRMLES